MSERTERVEEQGAGLAAVSEFAAEVAGRVARATASLEAARAADDDYLVSVLCGELESLARVADENGVEVPGLADAIQRHGTAAELRLPEEPAAQDGRIIDLGLSDDTQRIA